MDSRVQILLISINFDTIFKIKEYLSNHLIFNRLVTIDQDYLMELNFNYDLILYDKKTDEDGYLTWDAEHWTVVSAKKFMRTYSLGDRQLRDFTSHNIYDLRNDFKPEEAKEIQIN